MRLGQRSDGLCCSIVSWGLTAVNKQIVGDLVVAGQASSVSGSLQRAMLLFQSNSKANGHSVAHEMSIDHRAGEVSHTQLASLLANQLLHPIKPWWIWNDRSVCNSK